MHFVLCFAFISFAPSSSVVGIVEYAQGAQPSFYWFKHIHRAKKTYLPNILSGCVSLTPRDLIHYSLSRLMLFHAKSRFGRDNTINPLFHPYLHVNVRYPCQMSTCQPASQHIRMTALAFKLTFSWPKATASCSKKQEINLLNSHLLTEVYLCMHVCVCVRPCACVFCHCHQQPCLPCLPPAESFIGGRGHACLPRD